MKAFVAQLFQALSATAAVLLTTALLPAQPDYTNFVATFNKAREFNDTSGMDRAVRGNPRWVTHHFEAVLKQWLAHKDDQDRRKTLDVLKASFKRVFETDTLDKMEHYYSTVDAEKGALLSKAEQDWYKLMGVWDRSIKDKRPREEMEKVIEQSMTVARKYEELGHPLNAAVIWATLQGYIRALPNATVADKRDQIVVIKRFVDNRKAWDWTKDPYYMQWASWLKGQEYELEKAIEEEKKRKEAGFKEQAAGPDAYIVPNVKDVVSPLQFKALKKLPQDCFFRGGPIPSQWLAVRVGEADSAPVQLNWFKAANIYFVRAGANKFGVTLDPLEGPLDKKEWEQIDAPNKINKKPTIFHLDKEKKESYAMWFYTCGQSEPLMVGLDHNLAPQKEHANIYYRSGASWEATIHEVEVTFLDDNGDGLLFTEDPFAFGLKDYALGRGGKEEVPVPAYDSMIVGKGKPVPYSSWVKLGEKWFYLRQTLAGVGARPVHTDFFKTGTIQMKWGGSKANQPRLVIVRGKDAFSSAAFDIASGKPVEVPVGEYSIVYGRIESGKGKRVMLAHILEGDSKPVKVEEGKNVELEMGGPFEIDFKKEIDQGQVVLDSMFFKIRGRAGEHYVKVSGAPAVPEVMFARHQDGKGQKVVGEFLQVTNADIINDADKTLRERGIERINVDVCYFGIAKGTRDHSTVLKFTPSPPNGFVGLRQTKNKLFGRLGSTFK